MKLNIKKRIFRDKQTKKEISYCIVPKRICSVGQTTWLWLHRLETLSVFNSRKGTWSVAMYSYK